MNCQEVTERLLDFARQELAAPEAAAVRAHLDTCAACRAELAELRETWSALGAVGDESPSPALRARFDALLAGARESLAAPPARPLPLAWRRVRELPHLLPLAATLAALAVGFLAGRFEAGPARELDALRREVQSLNHVVALSFLDRDSASDRLHGVTLASQGGGGDPQVLQALLHAVREDPNVNVRLAAVDALAPYAAEPAVRAGLLEGFGDQASPLVQVAVADVVLDADGEAARGAVERALGGREAQFDPRVVEYVRRRLAGHA